jgi:hypothetical protein
MSFCLKILLTYGAIPEKYVMLEQFLKDQNQYDEDLLFCLDILCSTPQAPHHLIQYRESLRASVQEKQDKIIKQIEEGTSSTAAVIKQIILPYHIEFFSYEEMKPAIKKEKIEISHPKLACCILQYKDNQNCDPI